MSKTFFKMVGAVLCLTGMAGSAIAATKTLVGHVPSAVASAEFSSQLAGTNVLNLAISLPARDQAGLDSLMQQIYDPASTNYHQYLTPTQFAARFGATETDYQSVITFAQSKGLTVTATHANKLVVSVRGTAAQIQSAFQIQLNSYNHPTESRTFFAPTTDPVVDAALPVLRVSGLDSYYKPHPRIFRNNSPAMTPNAGSAPFGTYAGNDLRTAYVPGTTLTGAGQNVGLLQFDGFFPSDIDAYKVLIGMTNGPTIQVVPVNGGVSVPGFGNGEVCLDIEMILSMAPGVSNIFVYEAPNPSPWVDLLSRMANDNNAKQLSCSWGGGGPDAAAEQIFQQMALQGQSFFNASGDTDAFTTANPIEFPSDSPNITEVGGTTLITGAGAVYNQETVWNDRFPRPPGYQGSSGGISTTYSIPFWQQSVSMASNHGSTTQRNVPDVAMIANYVWVISDNGQGYLSGGTSAAAPLWAAFMALANQQAALNSRSSVGFINPAIYSLASTSTYTNVFHDVKTGDNTWPGSPTNFYAVTGYDLCTGLGTPNGTNLIYALAGAPGSGPVSGGGSVTAIITAPRPPWGTTLNVLNGGNPNGPWYLFVQDDKPLDIGGITNGWALNLTSANPVGFWADHQVYSSPSNALVNFGSTWNVTVAVTNYGPSIATNVLVTDALPISGLTLSSSSVSVGSLSQLGSSLLWNIPVLNTNAGGVLNIFFTASGIGTFTNSATVSAGTADPNPDEDTAISVANVAVLTPPSFSSITFSGGVPTFSVTNTSGPVSVIIQATTNLLTPINWVSIYTNTTPFSFTDVNATNYPIRFYRSIIGP